MTNMMLQLCRITGELVRSARLVGQSVISIRTGKAPFDSGGLAHFRARLITHTALTVGLAPILRYRPN